MTSKPSVIESMVINAMRQAPMGFGEPPRKIPNRVPASQDFFKMKGPRELDSDYDDETISESVWKSNHLHEDEEYDQAIFNITRLEQIKNQEKRSKVTLSFSVRDCPEKQAQIAEFSLQAKPTISKAPTSGQYWHINRKKVHKKKGVERIVAQVDFNRRKLLRDQAVDRVMAQAAEEMKRYPLTYNENELFDGWLEKRKRKRYSKD